MRPTWDEYFGYLVQVISLRSDDEETQVGSLIADHKNRIVAVGYNGTPRGTNLPHRRPEKYFVTLHAEQNCIITSRKDMENCKIYILGLLPCCDCAKLICQTGIKEVVIVNKKEIARGKDWGFEYTLEMFKQCNISMREIICKQISLI